MHRTQWASVAIAVQLPVKDCLLVGALPSLTWWQNQGEQRHLWHLLTQVLFHGSWHLTSLQQQVLLIAECR